MATVTTAATSRTKTRAKARTKAELEDRSYTRTEVITPRKAEAYLAFNKTNRPVRPAHVDYLQNTIETGQWETTHQGIAFNCNGDLLDGQHRLMACIRAGQPIRIKVTRGLGRNAMFAIDTGKIRNVTDIAITTNSSEVTARDAAVARRILSNFNPRYSAASRYTARDIIAFVDTHREALDFSYSPFMPDCAHGSIYATIARAYYTQDRERIKEFMQVMESGVSNGAEDSAAIVLRDHYIKFRRSFGASSGRAELYAKAQWALKKFLAREPQSKIGRVNAEQFPLPEEAAQGERSACDDVASVGCLSSF